MSSRLYTVLNLIYIPLFLEERSDADVRETTTVRSAIAIVPLVSFCGSFLASIFLNYKTKCVNDKVGSSLTNALLRDFIIMILKWN